MKTTAKTIALLAILVALGFKQARAEVVLDQEHRNGAAGWTLSQDLALGQSFTVQTVGIVTRVEAYLVRNATVPNAGVNLDLYSLDGPINFRDRETAMATGEIAASSITTTPQFVGVDYGATGVSVVPGDTLALVATTSADTIPLGGGTNPYAWRSPAPPFDYSAGSNYFGYSYNTVMTAGSEDLAFRVYVDTGSVWMGGDPTDVDDWGTGGNWSTPIVPDGPGGFATFGTSGSFAHVDLGGADRTLRMAVFAPEVSTTLGDATGHSLILGNGVQESLVFARGNSHRIETPVSLNGDLRVQSDGELTFAGPIDGGGGIVFDGLNYVILAGPGTFTGPTRLASGRLRIDHPLALEQSTLTLGTQDLGSLKFGNVSAATLGGLEGRRNLELTNTSLEAVMLSVGGNGTDTVYRGALAGRGGLEKIGDGTLTLGNVSTYEGPTIVRQGTLQFAPAPALIDFGGDGADWTVNNNQNISGPAFENDVLTLTHDGENDQGRSTFFNERILATDGFSVEFTYTVTATGSPADGMTFTIQNDPRGTGALGGRGHLLGYGQEGSMDAISPSLALEFDIFGTPGVRWATNGSIRSYSSVSPVGLGGANPIDVTIEYDAATGTLVETLCEQNTTNTKTYTWTGIELTSILGADDGYLGFTGATGGYTATQQISNFSAMVGGMHKSNILPIGTALRIAAGATVDLAGTLQTVGSLGDVDGGGGSLLLGGGTLTFGSDGADTTFSGTIDGAGSVVKKGSGETVLAGNHTFAGLATIAAGSLRVDGSLCQQSQVSVEAGATLGGHGSLDGLVVVQPGGSLDPGNSIGTIEIGSLTLQEHSVLQIEFASHGFDQIDVTAHDGLTIEGAQLALLWEPTSMPFVKSGVYPLIRYDGEIGGSGVASLSVLNPQPDVEYSFDVTSRPGWVSLTVVPEPSALTLLLASLPALLIGLARRARRAK